MAQAAFLGTNGLLAAQPVKGPGIVLVDPRTGRTRLICHARSQCGRPTNPRWAPDGRQIVTVDSGTGRVDVVTSAGACIVCVSDRPLISLPVRSAAFFRDSADLVVSTGGAHAQLQIVAFANSQPGEPFPGGGVRDARPWII